VTWTFTLIDLCVSQTFTNCLNRVLKQHFINDSIFVYVNPHIQDPSYATGFSMFLHFADTAGTTVLHSMFYLVICVWNLFERENANIFVQKILSMIPTCTLSRFMWNSNTLYIVIFQIEGSSHLFHKSALIYWFCNHLYYWLYNCHVNDLQISLIMMTLVIRTNGWFWHHITYIA